MIAESIEKLFCWVKSNRYLGYDIYDGLNCSYLNNIKNTHLRLIILQGNKYCPINLRPFLGIEKGVDTKGMALFTQAYARLYSTTCDERFLKEMKCAIDYIIDKSLKDKYGHDCWASHYFPYISLDKSTLSIDTPDIIGTSQAIIALLRSYEITKREVEKEVAKSAINYMIRDLFIDDELMSFFKYSESNIDKNQITLNATAQALEAISSYLNIENDNQLLHICEEAANTLLCTQRDDGAWAYTLHLDRSVKRIQLDFHHGFIIDSLLAFYRHSNKQDELQQAINKATIFYKKRMFNTDGSSSFRYPIPFPTDIHNQAQGIITFSKLKQIDNGYNDLAYKIAIWTIKNMQDPSGYFYYQKWPIITNKIPYMRWSQAWMMLALSSVYKNGENNDD